MNVLFVSNDPSIFIAESSARARMREYARAIGSLHILTPCGAYHGPATIEDGPLTLHAVHGSKFMRFMLLPKRIKSLIRTYQIEIVSAQDPFEYGRVAQKGVRGTSAKLHIQIHTDFLSPWFTRRGMTRASQGHMPLLNRIRQKLAHKVLPHADGIRVVSKRIQDSLVSRYGTALKQITVIPIHVSDTVPPAVPLPPHPFTFTLIAVSRLESEKRIEDILRAIHKIADAYPSVGLMIAGDGRERHNLENMVRHLGLESRVMFLGDRSDAWGLMQSAQAFIQASAYEGYGRTLIEAALAKLPIITTDVGIVGEVFRGYESVLAVPVGDPSALATHIVGLVEDAQARKEFALNGEQAARTHLATVHNSPEDIAADLQKVLTTS